MRTRSRVPYQSPDSSIAAGESEDDVQMPTAVQTDVGEQPRRAPHRSRSSSRHAGEASRPTTTAHRATCTGSIRCMNDSPPGAGSRAPRNAAGRSPSRRTPGPAVRAAAAGVPTRSASAPSRAGRNGATATVAVTSPAPTAVATRRGAGLSPHHQCEPRGEAGGEQHVVGVGQDDAGGAETGQQADADRVRGSSPQALRAGRPRPRPGPACSGTRPVSIAAHNGPSHCRRGRGGAGDGAGPPRARTAAVDVATEEDGPT